MKTYNIYIDESCHLLNDYSRSVMAIGYIKCDLEEFSIIKENIKAIKELHSFHYEIKWNKVSASRLPFYKELVDYFFNSNLTFRCVLIKYKERLDHESYNQGDHNNFYYKIVYQLLHNSYTTPINDNKYRIYFDLKDTRSIEKIKKLKQVFDSEFKERSPYIHFQNIRSHESEFIQLADLFIGAITYKTRRNFDIARFQNQGKIELIGYIEEKSGYTLDEGTVPWETKFNIFDQQPKRHV